MAYIPPHKRQSKDTDRSLPTPQLLDPQVRRFLDLRPSRSNVKRLEEIIFAKQAIFRWFIIGLNEDNQFPSSVQLDEHPLEWKGFQLLVLVNSRLDKENNQVRENILRSPWVSIAENVQQDLLTSFEIVRNEMECQELEKVKPTLVARFGKILFRGSPSLSTKSVDRSQVAETTLRQLNKLFYTGIPTSYMENIIGGVAPNIGVDFEEKERYLVLLHDRARPDATISCKCSVEHDKKLEPYKVELRQVRHMVIDILCLAKDLDLSLMLYTKRILTALTDDEKHCISDLINSAELDSSVMGGLRWPQGKDTSGGRFHVVGVDHQIIKAYRSPSLSLRVIHTDRCNFETSTEEARWKIDLKLKKVLSELQEKVQINSILDTLKDNLRLIWDHCLCFSEGSSSESDTGSLALVPTSTPKAPEVPKFTMAGESPFGSVTKDLQKVYLHCCEFRIAFSQVGQALFEKFAPCPSRPVKIGVIITELTTDQEPASTSASASARVTKASAPSIHSIPIEMYHFHVPAIAEASQKVSSEPVANEVSIIQVTELPTAAPLVSSTCMEDVVVPASQEVSLTSEEQILEEAEAQVPDMAVDEMESVNLDTLPAATPSPHIPRAQDVPAPPQASGAEGLPFTSEWAVFQEAKVHADLVPFLEKAWGKHEAFVPIGALQSNTLKSFIFEVLGQILKDITITPLSELSDGRVKRMVEIVSDLKFCHCRLDWLDEPMQKLHIQVGARQRLRDIGELDDHIEGMELTLLEVKQDREDLLSENRKALEPFGGNLDLSKPSSEGLL